MLNGLISEVLWVRFVVGHEYVRVSKTIISTSPSIYACRCQLNTASVQWSRVEAKCKRRLRGQCTPVCAVLHRSPAFFGASYLVALFPLQD